MPQDNDIYKFLKANNLTDKDEKTFLQEYSNPEKAKEIYSFFKANHLTDKDETVFFDTYLKKKEPLQSSDGGLQQNGYKSMLTPFQEGISRIQEPQLSQKPKQKPNQFISIGEEVTPTNTQRPQEVKLSAVNYDNAVNTALKKRGIDKTNPLYKAESEKLYKKVREGELVGHKKENGEDVLLRGEGFGESLVNTIARSAHDTKEAFKINSITDPKELAAYFENNPLSEQESKPSGIGGELGELIGGVVKPAVLLTGNAVAPGVGTGIMAAEATYSAMGRQKRELFDRGISEGLTPEEAAKKAMETAPISAIPEGVMAAALGTNLKGIGNAVNKAADAGFKKALTNSIKSVAKVSAGGAATELASTGLQAAKGYNITPMEALDRSWNSATGWAKMDAAFKILGMAGAAPKYLKSAAKEYIATLPKEEVTQFKDQLPAEERANIGTQLSNYENARKQVEGLVPEENMSTFAGLVEKRNNLEKSKEGKAKSLAEPIQKEIDDIDQRLTEMQRSGKVVEIDDVTGEQTLIPKKHEELTKQEREGIVVPKEYGTADVIEKGEGENKTFRPEATYTVKEGGLEKSVKIKIKDEGKVYTSKEAAQKAADEALAKHFYENQMPDYDKPEAKESKVPKPTESQSNTVEEVNPVEQKTEKTIKQLEEENKSTLPKVRSENVFKNKVETLSKEELAPSDYYMEGDHSKELPTEDVDISKIVPTQKTLTTTNIESVRNIKGQPSEDIVLFQKGDKYYVLDGHHRIASDILKGENKIKAKVFSEQITHTQDVSPSKEKVFSRVKEYLGGKKPKEIQSDKDIDFIPLETIFENKVEHIPDEFYDIPHLNRVSEYLHIPEKEVDVSKIIPTQNELEGHKLYGLSKFKDFEGAKDKVYLFEKNGKYYIADGTHRIASQIINGAKKIKAHVIEYNEKNIKDSERYWKDISRFKQQPDIWTHLTNRRETIESILKTGKFIGKDEDLSHFTKEVSKNKFNLTKENALSPYFQKGKFYGEPFQKYLITTRGDDKFTPNLNKSNRESFEKSKWVGVLNPEYRGGENFIIYEKGDDGHYYMIDQDKFLNKKQTENAIQERSTEKAIMDEASRDSEKMGERIPESGKTSKEGKQIESDEGVIPPTEPPVTETTAKPKEPRFNDKSILKRLTESENIRPETREKFKENLKYKVKSQEEARTVAKDIIKEYDIDEAVTLAESGKFHGDVNSMIFGEALDNLYRQEQEAKTPQEKLALAERWADVSMRYDEAARSGGRFISAIGDFYKKSPLGIRLKEEDNRNEVFKEWFKNKETNYKEVFEALREEPEFKNLIKEEVQSELKKERAQTREKRRKNIEDFFDKAKFKGGATYATIIPPNVINGGIEAMKQAFLAGESVVSAVEKAIHYISTEVKDWDKEKFRKEWEEKLRNQDGGKKSKLTDEELTEQKKQRLLERFRKKLKGLSEKEKEEVIRKSFKKLVENGALEYEDFKQIIKQTLGLGELTQEQKTKIDQYVKDINSVEDLAEKARSERTDKSLTEFRNAVKKAEKSATQLGQIVYNKPNIWRRLSSIMQLNTLGIPSLVNNPIFNIVNQAAVRFPKAVQLTAIDKTIQAIGKLLGKDWKPNTNIFVSQKPFFRGVGEGVKQSAEQAISGLTNKDYFQKEVYTMQIHPFTSAKELWQWGKGDLILDKSQVVDKSLQATVGLPAEIVARTLNIGDKPQRFAAERATAKVIANQYGLKGMDEKLFTEFPKQEAYRLERAKGLSEEAAMKKAEEIEKRIIREGEESTFQQENVINQAINYIGKGYDKVAEGNAPLELAGKLGGLFKTMNLPFVKIPLNAYWSYFNLVNPEVAGAQSLIFGASAAYKKARGMEGWQKDFEQSKKWLAHASTGLAMLAVTGTLAKNGIITGDNSIKDTKKEREGEKNYEQQHSINMGKLQAFLNGQDPNQVTDGLNVDLKWLGVLGNALNMQANKIEDLTAAQRANGTSIIEDLAKNANHSALEMFENGVFSNTSSLFQAINNGGGFADAYLMNLVNMGTNIVQPAMFAQMSRAQLPNDYTTKADSFIDQLKNNMSARSSLYRELSGKYPHAKVGIWGDKLDRSDNWMLKWFGMSRYNKDNFAQPIYEDYKKTGNTRFFPPSIKPEINNQKLNVEQTRHLEQLVGESRKELVAPYINGVAQLPLFGGKIYQNLNIEEKLKALSILYQQGYQYGVEKFEAIYPQFKQKEKTTDEDDLEKEVQENASDLRSKIKN